MSVNEDLMVAAVMAATRAARNGYLAELEDRLRYGDTEEETELPRGVRTAHEPLMCSTCGYVTEVGGIEDRDREHRRYDGAHEPGWYAETDEITRIASDLELIRLLVERTPLQSR